MAPSPLRLFCCFFRLGLTAFGGPAMIAHMRVMAVQKEGWIVQEDFMRGIVICQTIPGATVMQMAAYTGLRSGGVRGAIAAFAGFGLPAFVLMLAFSILYSQGRNLDLVAAVFNGLQVIVVTLMVQATVYFGRSTLHVWQDWLLGLAVAAGLLAGGSAMVALAAAALAGLLLSTGDEGLKLGAGAASGSKLTFAALVPPLILALLLLAGLGALFFINRGLFDLAFMMTKIDLFAFGGGFGSIPLLFNEVVTTKQWLTSQTLMDGIALGQVTPGPIVITATFVGFLHNGMAGALVATIAIFTPSLTLLLAVAPTFDHFGHHPLFQRAMRGILAAFTGLLLSVTLHFALAVPWEAYRIGWAILALIALWFKIDVLWVVLTGVVLSVLQSFFIAF